MDLPESEIKATDATPRLTPTQRLHEVTLTALQRSTTRASESASMGRNSKGDVVWDLNAVAGEDEGLMQAVLRAEDCHNYLSEKHPLSHAQDFERRYSKHDRGQT